VSKCVGKSHAVRWSVQLKQGCLSLFNDGLVAIFSSTWRVKMLKTPRQNGGRSLGGSISIHFMQHEILIGAFLTYKQS